MIIKTIRAKDATPDMVLGEEVRSYSRQMIVPKGTILDNRAITRMKFYSINEIKILIHDEAVEEVDIPLKVLKVETEEELQASSMGTLSEEHPNKEGLLEVIRTTEEYQEFNNNVWESAKVLEDSISEFILRNGEDLNTNKLLNRTKEIIAMSRTPLHTFHMLQNMRDYDDATFIHCLNVAIICNAFGRWLNMPQEDLDILTLSGLLHDIGKMRIPEEIIKKPGILTDAEYSVVKLHPRRGYNILQPMRIDQRIKNVALMHHERYDGSGYPSQMKGEDIDEFGRIVAIADIYDAMTSARIYRGPLCPFDVISVFETEGYQKFDPKFLIPFLEGIMDSYLNTKVVLSDGREGVIRMINKQALSRPVIQVGKDFIDLNQEKEITIQYND